MIRRLAALTVALCASIVGCVHPAHNHPFLVCTRAHESDTLGGYGAHSPGWRHHGAYQFLQSTWDSVARHMGWTHLVGVDPHTASGYEQDAMALALYEWQGNDPWEDRC